MDNFYVYTNGFSKKDIIIHYSDIIYFEIFESAGKVYYSPHTSDGHGHFATDGEQGEQIYFKWLAYKNK